MSIRMVTIRADWRLVTAYTERLRRSSIGWRSAFLSCSIHNNRNRLLTDAQQNQNTTRWPFEFISGNNNGLLATLPMFFCELENACLSRSLQISKTAFIVSTQTLISAWHLAIVVECGVRCQQFHEFKSANGKNIHDDKYESYMSLDLKEPKL